MRTEYILENLYRDLLGTNLLHPLGREFCHRSILVDGIPPTHSLIRIQFPESPQLDGELEIQFVSLLGEDDKPQVQTDPEGFLTKVGELRFALRIPRFISYNLDNLDAAIQAQQKLREILSRHLTNQKVTHRIAREE